MLNVKKEIIQVNRVQTETTQFFDCIFSREKNTSAEKQSRNLPARVFVVAAEGNS